MNQFTNHQTSGDDCRESGEGETKVEQSIEMVKPQDSDILSELQGAGRDGKPTYYLRNCLLLDGFEITTQQLRSRLKYLEKKGVVRRTKSPFFKNNISWGLV